MAVSALKRQIEEAQQAQAALAEGDALRAKAEELPELLRRQEQERQQAQANAELAALEADVKATLAEAAKKAADFQQRFEGLIAEFEALVKELPTIEKPIHNAGSRLQRAIPDSVRFSDTWDRLGGRDPGLAVLPSVRPPGSAARALGDLLQRGARTVVYRPATGARIFMRLS